MPWLLGCCYCTCHWDFHLFSNEWQSVLYLFCFKLVHSYQSGNYVHYCKVYLKLKFRTSSQVLLNCRDVSSPYLEGARKVLQNMYELWQRKQLCDVTLECKDGVLYAHKLVMASYSDSLCKRFSDYPLSQPITIALKEYSSAACLAVLEFMYTIELKLTIHNVGEILSLANELGIVYIQNMALSFFW